jgi:hypothetical protein
MPRHRIRPFAAAVAGALVVLLAITGVAAAATAPTAITGPVTTYGPTTATVTGTVNPNGDATTWHFEYGKTTTYGTNTAATSAGSGTANSNVSSPLTGLSPGTTYHYRLVATNAGGTTQGADGLFTTSAAPGVSTAAPTGLSATGATLNGTVSPNGRATTWYFEYGKSSAYGTKTPAQNAGSDTGSVPVSAAISGLETGSTYHYRLVATSDAGTSQSGDQTLALVAAPTVVTNPATSVTTSGAKLNGSVNANGQAATYYFEYGPTTSYGTKTAVASAGSATTAKGVSATVNGLAASTTYHYRLVSSNASGTTFGGDQSFGILGPPIVQTGSAQNGTTTGATLTGSVNPQGRTTNWYFEYGTSTAYGSKTTAKSAGSATTAIGVSAVISGLTPGTTYHYRVVGTSSAGTVRGADVAFSTAGSLTISTPTSETIYGHFVSLSGVVSSKQPGVTVTILAQPFGATSFASVATVLSGNGGIWSYPAQPKRRTAYEATADGGTSAQVVIGVRPAVSLRIITKARFSTRVVASTSFARRFVQLQRLTKGGKWVTLGRSRLTAKSTAIFRAALLPTGKSTIRVAMSVNQAGPGYLAGFSRLLTYRRA